MKFRYKREKGGEEKKSVLSLFLADFFNLIGY